MMSGGIRRIVPPWATLMSTPLSRQYLCTMDAVSAVSIWTPMMSPHPRTSLTLGESMAFRSAIHLAPISLAWATTPSLFMTSRTAHPALHTSGFPPKVVPWVPGVMTAEMPSVVVTAPMGVPPPRALAMVMISGTTP